MPTENEPTTIYERGWVVRIQSPRSASKDGETGQPGAETRVPARSLLLLHGWTGDETVMWIFTRGVPASYWIFAPRAPVQAPEGGYGWVLREDGWPRLDQFKDVAGTLLASFRRWAVDRDAPQEPFDVMGFSQGAAMAYALAAYYPQQVNRIIALAGFLPNGETLPGSYRGLGGKKIYIAHGVKDETVPVQMAQQAVRNLQAVGAQVTYCESEVGHKLSINCLRGLETFLA